MLRKGSKMEKTGENNLRTKNVKQDIRDIAKLFFFGFTALFYYIKSKILRKGTKWKEQKKTT